MCGSLCVMMAAAIPFVGDNVWGGMGAFIFAAFGALLIGLAMLTSLGRR